VPVDRRTPRARALAARGSRGAGQLGHAVYSVQRGLRGVLLCVMRCALCGSVVIKCDIQPLGGALGPRWVMSQELPGAPLLVSPISLASLLAVCHRGFPFPVFQNFQFLTKVLELKAGYRKQTRH
jgi:hypothetical protein